MSDIRADVDYIVGEFDDVFEAGADRGRGLYRAVSSYIRCPAAFR